ncbi:MAG TPA: acryloyl-CoA reductase [Trueperaceae bacterium]|nr:acryloyl-CoA reductase [Trueperaceae bacterium]
MTKKYKALRSEEKAEQVSYSIKELDLASLPDNDVLIKVKYSALNYKDALSATGHRGVTREYPHTPGIDAAGVVVESKDSMFQLGDKVIVTSYDLGMNTDGGFAEYIRVPSKWVVLLPEGLSLRTAMMLGTAGFTAAQCVYELMLNDLQDSVLVTGASGGVGSIAVALLANKGFKVTASTGSISAHKLLRDLGAQEIINRSELAEENKRPILKARFNGAVDTVGGVTLDNIIKQLHNDCAVAACGLVGGDKLDITVYPFILRGVKLLGISSENYEMSKRKHIWKLLATDWQVDLEPLTTEINLEDLPEYIPKILAGQTQGHILVKVAD